MILNPSPLDPFIPILIALFKQSGFDRKWNAWIAIGVYAVWTIFSFVTGLRAVGGPLTFEAAFNAFVTAATIGLTSYTLVWKNLPGNAEQTIEHSTSIFKGPVSDPVIEPEPTDTGSNG